MNKFKVALLTFLVTMASSVWAQPAPVNWQTGTAPNGAPIIRYYNPHGYWIVCRYQDAANFFTFSIAPYTWTNWSQYWGRPFIECVFS